MQKLFNRLRKSLKIRWNRTFKNEFRKRIEKRKFIFWEDPKRKPITHNRLFASDPIEKWKNFPHWQRLLENKLNSKEFAKKFGSTVAKLYWSGDEKEFVSFDLNSLPENFIIKPVIGSSSKNVYIMKGNKNLFDGQCYSLTELKAEVLDLFASRPGLELIIEEFVPNENGDYVVPNDYRFYMFNGHLLFIRLDKRSAKAREEVLFFNEDWSLIDRKILDFADTSGIEAPPMHLAEMISEARKLSEQYEIFVRLDFYESPTGPVFGEFTNTPRGGVNFTRYGSKRLIQAWDEHCRGRI